VVSYGDWNMVSDLLAQRYPVVHVPAAIGSAMSMGHVLLHPELDDFDIEPLEDQVGEYSLFSFKPLMPQVSTEPITREELGIPEDAFCYVVVGNRLPEEIDHRFLSAVKTLLKNDKTARIVVVGSNYNGEVEARLPHKYERRVIHLPFQDDLIALFKCCDAFLNPFRQGGGVSGFLAIRAGLPVVTLRDCDVASHSGREWASANYDDYITHAKRLLEDEAYRAACVEGTVQQAQKMPLLIDAPEELEAACADAEQRFAELQASSIQSLS
jgi:glycosyltransferase involved in cell wall biosynthesis